MLNAIIEWSLANRILVLAASLVLIGLGAVAVLNLPIDAFPDTTPVQVQINTYAPGMAPVEVERQITFPVELALGGLPRIEQVRSISKFGLSQVVVTFADGTDIHFGRQVLTERLSTVELSEGMPRPQLGPIATGLGEVLHYTVRNPQRTRRDFILATSVVSSGSSDLLNAITTSGCAVSFSRSHDRTMVREIQEWVLRPALRTVPGTAEINTWGGLEHQYQVRIDPQRLIQFHVTFDQVMQAVKANNLNVGGGSLERSGSMYLVHGIARTSDVEQIGNIVVTTPRDGVAVHVRDVADVMEGYDVPIGGVTAQGQGPVVLGLGFMLMGENPHDVTERLKNKLDDVKKNLPADIEVTTVYDRTELVNTVLDTVRRNLFEGGLLVIAVLFIFLGNLRAGLIVALSIPISMLFAFTGMVRFGIAGSLLSLGAIDFGLVADSSVVMVENVVRHLAHDRDVGRSRLDVVRTAALEVRGPTMFGELIIMIVYLPILTLEGVEGKLFRPMALTVIFALVGSMVMSLTLMPVLASWVLPRHVDEKDPWIVRLARWIYDPLLRLSLRNGVAVIGLALAALAVGVLMALSLGSEFVPRLSEGALVVNILRLPGTNIDEAMRYNTRMEQILLEKFPNEVKYVWARCGTAEVATDPMGPEETDFFIALKPREEWREKIESQDDLVKLMRKECEDLPGQRITFEQPIEQRIKEMISGVRAAVAVKIFGDDYDKLKDIAEDVEKVLKNIEGSVEVSTDQVSGLPVMQVRLRQDELARYGVSARQVFDRVEALGGKVVGDVFEGQIRHMLAIRLPQGLRKDPEAFKELLVTASSGEQVPLSRLADVNLVEGPAKVSREWGQRLLVVKSNVKDRDIGSFVAEAQRRVEAEVKMPKGRYRIEWGGDFENLARARLRLIIVVPVALALIFSLLYVTYGRLMDVVLVFTAVPFASVGGVLALWLRGLPFSISAGVGFVALSGVSVLNSMVLVSFIRHLREQGVSADDSIEEAALTRLRPVLMTALVASLGFLPMALSRGVGAEVQRPLATVVIGGVISSTLLTLLVLPVLYHFFGPKPATEVRRPSAETAAVA
jgi:cobalt-zinc-cadmium resistance protein CzcA